MPVRPLVDPTRPLVVLRDGRKYNGRMLRRGEPFDPEGVKPPVLRTYLGQKVIGYADENPDAVAYPSYEINPDNGQPILKTDPRGLVAIPGNWRERSFPERKGIASQLSQGAIRSKAQANAAIVAEIERRGGTA